MIKIIDVEKKLIKSTKYSIEVSSDMFPTTTFVKTYSEFKSLHKAIQMRYSKLIELPQMPSKF